MKSLSVLLFVASLIFWGTVAHANFTQIKAYKDAFPGSTPKCINCHVDKMPKKDDGAHELNDYGKSIAKAAGTSKPTADTYKSVGPIKSN